MYNCSYCYWVLLLTISMIFYQQQQQQQQQWQQQWSQCSVVQCGVVWCGVVQCGVVWCSTSYSRVAQSRAKYSIRLWSLGSSGFTVQRFQMSSRLLNPKTPIPQLTQRGLWLEDGLTTVGDLRCAWCFRVEDSSRQRQSSSLNVKGFWVYMILLQNTTILIMKSPLHYLSPDSSLNHQP